MERITYGVDGQLLTGSLADYAMPMAGAFPKICVITMENHPSPINPLGAKGAGEGGIVPAAAVIANAVADALSPFGADVFNAVDRPPFSHNRIRALLRGRTPQ